MPSGKSREETIIESMNSPKKLDTNVSIKINYSSQQFDSNKYKYKCSCCGKGYNTQKSNFHKTNSTLFQSNDGYLPWCCECEDKFLIQLTALFSGNEEHAIEFYCQLSDWVYDFEVLKQAREISSDRSRISHYSAKKNLNVGGRKTFIDSLKFTYLNRKNNVIESKEHLEQLRLDGMTDTTMASAERWGIGIFEDEDYKILDSHYKMLKKANPNCDSNQEIFIKSLCHLNMIQMKALKENNTKNYIDANSEYAKTFKQAGLKTIQDTDKNADDCWGLFMEQISQHTPEEYYKDKKLYKDFDGIGEEFKRFVLRPLKNLLCKTKDRDPEYNVEDSANE